MSSQKMAILAAFLIAGCSTAPSPAVREVPDVISLGGITTDATGRCFTRQDAPTRTSVVSELVEVVPEQRDRNGVVIQQAIFRSVTRPQTVAVAEGARFETLCPQIYTPDVVSTLQRALIVRRAYAGPVTGTLDAATSDAIRRFQQPLGINSPILEISVARDLGIVAVPR